MYVIPAAVLPANCEVKESSVHLAPRPAVSLFDKTEKPVIVSLSVDMPTAVCK